MKCLSRSTLGIVIGAINIFVFIVLIIYIIAFLAEIGSLPKEDDLADNAIVTTSVTVLYILLIIFIFSLFISILLVLGIIKERHTFMKPWIYGAIGGIIYYILRLIIGVFVGLTTGMSFGTIFIALLIGLMTLSLQILIFYPIYTLYTDIRDAATAQEQRGLNVEPQNPPNYGELEKGGELYN